MKSKSLGQVVPQFGLGTRRVMASFGLSLALAASLGATTFYVATTGNDSNGGTQTAPFATIQRGVDLAKAGDTIIVGDGTYGPNGHYTCGTICSQNGYAAPVVFYNSGTSSAPITITAQNKWGAILDCQLPYGYSGDGTDGVQACDAYFDFQSNASYINIQNFDITRGYWVGAMVNGSNNHNIQFTGNHFHHIGNRHYTVPNGTQSFGIVGVYAGTPTSYLKFDKNEFNNIGRLPTSGQSANDYNHDHGLYVYNGPYTITNNIFYANTAGWGVQISPGTHDTLITNNTFRGPNPQQDGLIMLWADSAHPNTNITIQNNIFYNGLNYAIGSWQANEVNTVIDHNIEYGSPNGMLDTSVVKGTLTLSNNRINTDPKFVSVSNNDYHLQSGSPAIDTGASVALTTDFESNPRPQGSAVDLGSYESAGTIGITPTATTFSIWASASAATLTRKQSTVIGVIATLLSGSSQPATFAVSGLPPGISASWSSGSCGLSCSSNLTLSASAHPKTGTSVLMVTVTAGGASQTANVTLTVN